MGVDEPEEQKTTEWRTSTCGERLHSRLHPAPSVSIDYPNFERRSRSDVSQISGRVANPLASPQPVVSVHFEVITGEELILIPHCFSNSPGEPHILPAHAYARTHTQKGYNVTRSGQVYAAVVSSAKIHTRKNWKSTKEVVAVWVNTMKGW